MFINVTFCYAWRITGMAKTDKHNDFIKLKHDCSAHLVRVDSVHFVCAICDKDVLNNTDLIFN